MNDQIRKALLNKGFYLYLLPTYTQAKKVVWQNPEMMKHFPDAIIESKNNTELYIKFRNGSIWQLGGTDKPESWRGTNPIDVVFDEYAEMKESIWLEVIRPILTENHGTATFIFTPRGKNHAWKLLEYARQNSGNWYHSILTVNDTHAIPQEDLDEARREMTEMYYKQEFLCEFQEGASDFFRGVSSAIWDGRLQISTNKTYQLGCDLAKYNDWTVLTPFDLTTFKAGFQERFNQIDWNLQKARIEAFYLRFNKGRLFVDRTGIGDPIVDDLTKKQINVEPVVFNEQTRKDLLTNLQLLIEQGKIKIPNDPILISELQSFQYQLGERGKIKISVPEGLHDDCVFSLALAVWGIPTKPIPESDPLGKRYEHEFDFYKQHTQAPGLRRLRK